MSRIKIEDLPEDQKISLDEMKQIFGGLLSRSHSQQTGPGSLALQAGFAAAGFTGQDQAVSESVRASGPALKQAAADVTQINMEVAYSSTFIKKR